jgi:hypothetical protein
MSSPLPLASHHARSGSYRLLPSTSPDQQVRSGILVSAHPHLDARGRSQAYCHVPVGTGGSQAPKASRTAWSVSWLSLLPQRRRSGTHWMTTPAITGSLNRPGWHLWMGAPRLVTGRPDTCPFRSVSWPQSSSGWPFRSRLLPVCCPVEESGTAPARRKRPARPVTRALWGWR